MFRKAVLAILASFLALTSARAETVAVPMGQQIFTYETLRTSKDGVDPAQMRPMYFDTSGNTFDLYMNLAQFSQPVDAYLLLYFPAIDNANFAVVREDKQLQPLSDGLAAWRTGLSATIVDTQVLKLLPENGLATGSYYFILLVTPQNNFNSYYMWITKLGVVDIGDFMPLSVGNRWNEILSAGTATASPRDFIGVELDFPSSVTVAGTEVFGGTQTTRIQSNLGFEGWVTLDGNGFSVHKTSMPTAMGTLDFLYETPFAFPRYVTLGDVLSFDSTVRVSTTTGSIVQISPVGGGSSFLAGNDDIFNLTGRFRFGRENNQNTQSHHDFFEYTIKWLPIGIDLDQYLAVEGMGAAMPLPYTYRWNLHRDWGWKSCFGDFSVPGQDDFRLSGRTSLALINGIGYSRWGSVDPGTLSLDYKLGTNPADAWEIKASYHVTPAYDGQWNAAVYENGQPSDRFSTDPASGTGPASVDFRFNPSKFDQADRFSFEVRYSYADFNADLRLQGSFDVTESGASDGGTLVASTNSLTGNFNYFSDCPGGTGLYEIASFDLTYPYNWTINHLGALPYLQWEPSFGTGNTRVHTYIDCSSVFTGDTAGSIYIDGVNPGTGAEALNGPIQIHYDFNIL